MTEKCAICGRELMTMKREKQTIVFCPNPKCTSVDIIYEEEGE